MNKKVSVSNLICCVLLTAALTFSVTSVFSAKAYSNKILDLYERQSMYEKLEEIDRIGRYNSICDIDESRLTAGLIEGYLAGIGDADASYLTAAENKRGHDAGFRTGLGIRTTLSGSGYLYVYDLIEGAGGAAGGLMRGDFIYKVNGFAASSDEAEALLNSSAEGTQLTLEVYRGSENITLAAVCRQYSFPSVSYSLKAYQVGYIRITEFESNTYDLFLKALNSLSSASASGIILDLRKTSGGALNVAANIIDRIVPQGDIMSKTSRDGTVELVYSSNPVQLDLPLIVLIDGDTAGPAELVAAAVSEYGKGSTVGTVTAGKGGLQELFTLSDGSGVMLSTAVINTPKGRSFDKTGISPDYESSLPTAGDYYFYSMAPEDDIQLKKALEVISGLIDPSYLGSGAPEANYFR